MKVITAIGLIATMIVVVAGVYFIRFNHKSATDTDTAVANVPQNSNTVRYLPLGDSYTIGQSVSTSDRWPNQLQAVYMPSGKRLQIVANPAVTGYTSQDLIDEELQLVSKHKPDLVTVQIGVNDYVQQVSEQRFQKNLDQILSYLQTTMSTPRNILLVTIPDYAKTPAGANYGDTVAATQAIERYNKIIITAANKAKLPVADIFSVSQQVVSDPSLVAFDGLHPSGKQYGMWTSVVKAALEAAKVPS